MIRTWANVAIAALILALVPAGTAWGQTKTPAADSAVAAAPDPSADLALVAIERAAKADKYIFLFCYRAADEETRTARKTFDAATEEFADRAATAQVNVADPLEQDFVGKYNLSRAPMPLVLVLAPNGAVTRAFPVHFTEAQLEGAFVSPGMQKCLKALQERKLVFLCVQNATTRHNPEAMQGVNAFASDAQYAKTTEIISVDPTDSSEAGLLRRFSVDPKTDEAITVFLAPPGSKIATYTGQTDKDVLIAAAKTAARGCDPKSGCCAPKKPDKSANAKKKG
jgi:hypothetical protein